jgi:porin
MGRATFALGAASAVIPALAAAVALATASPSPAPTAAPIHLRGHFVGEAAANPTGGLQRGTAFAGEFMLGADIDFAKLTGAGGTLHVTLTEREGSSLSTNTIGNIFTVQEIYGDGLTPRLTEFSYEQAFAKGKVDAIAGRVITENDFAVSPVYWGDSLYCTFQNNGICGTPISIPINSGYVAYPSSAWGARVKVMPTSSFYVETGAYQVNPNYGLRGHGFDLSTNGDTGTYLPLEIGFRIDDYNGTSTGNVRIGGYYDTSTVFGVQNQIARFVAPNSPALAALPNVPYAGRWGYWLQADHLLSGSDKKHERGIAAFASLVYGDPRTALLSFFGDAGVVAHGTFAGRNDDTISLGYAYGNVNPQMRSFESSLIASGFSVPLNGQERVIELNYGLLVRPGFTLRPGFQYVIAPAGNLQIPNALVAGLQANVGF